MQAHSETAVPPALRHLRTEVTELDRQTRAFATQHPFVALGAAVTLGYVLGRVLSRGWR